MIGIAGYCLAIASYFLLSSPKVMEHEFLEVWKMRSMKVSAPTWQYSVAIKNEKHLQTQLHLDNVKRLECFLNSWKGIV